MESARRSVETEELERRVDVVPVVWRRPDDEDAKARIAEVEAKGWQVHLIVVGQQLFARDVQDAERLVTAERERGNTGLIEVLGPKGEGTEELPVLHRSGGPELTGD